ncbi:MAG: GNAT family N-acetyltransferase [Microvirga sp.]
MPPSANSSAISRTPRKPHGRGCCVAPAIGACSVAVHSLGEVGAAFYRRGVDPVLDRVPEASWLFSSQYRGSGFAFEAMSGLLRWVERGTSHDRVACLIEPINLPSLKLAERLGFRPVKDVSYRDKLFILMAT